LIKQKRFDEAAGNFDQWLKLQPGSAAALNDYLTMVWSLATNPDPALRDGPKSLQFAERLTTNFPGGNALHLSILAAAQAENSQFDAAVKSAGQARQMALQQGNLPLASTIDQQLSFYRSAKPYHQEQLPNANTTTTTLRRQQ